MLPSDTPLSGHALALLASSFRPVTADPIVPGFAWNGGLCVMPGTRLKTARLEASVDAAKAGIQAQRQVLAVLESGSRPEEIRKAQAEADAAKATAKAARDTYLRLQKLLDRKLASLEEVEAAVSVSETAQAKVRAAEAALALVLAGPRQEDIAKARAELRLHEAELTLAKVRLADASLYATADGIIRDRILEPGDMASPQTPVITLALVDPVWVRAYLPEPALGRIAPGMQAEIHTDSYPEKSYRGWIGYISPSAEFTPKNVETPELRTRLVYQARIYACNPNGELRLGMPVAERCAEVILLHEGKIVAQGAPTDFSEAIQGRVFHASQKTGSKRQLLSRLSSTPGILDAVIDGERIRLIMENPDTPLPKLGNATIAPASPRFEDAFVAILKAQPQADRPSLPSVRHRPTSSIEDGQIITIENVARRFNDFYAVKDISFSVRRGEIFGLLGANGAGKSTTFRMLCGLLPVSAGRLSVAGYDLRHAAARARGRIGYMAQRFSLYSNLTVLQNLHFFASAYGLRSRHRQERIHWALNAFELASYSQSNSGDLPLGFKQRLAFACALMHEPDILFLDEPTSGVDPLARREFWQRTNALADEGVTVLITTHFMDEANYCDRLVIMSDGQILAQGTPKEIKQPFRTAETPEPNMEDAFIALIEGREQVP